VSEASRRRRLQGQGAVGPELTAAFTLLPGFSCQRVSYSRSVFPLAAWRPTDGHATVASADRITISSALFSAAGERAAARGQPDPVYLAGVMCALSFTNGPLRYLPLVTASGRSRPARSPFTVV